ncbi:hypothetical protein NS226_13710 [Aureimonas ureilytica]|uniref:GH16 domain-containing protein n=1 Tax=Aureimonas ureilytica TaxID=401562 RepID=A0A175R6B2_9HYPH|nr:family 16 glycosylhydrolase [Aureimonas ureilytica]KTQ94982.1 hypothetical protein NS226_13710 [Aureimonas ureilytica]
MKDLSNYTLTFSDEFDSHSISQNGGGTTWADIRPEWRFDANSDIGFGRSSFVDAASGYDPFKVQDGVLTITAVPDRTPYGMPGSWESGLIHTRGSFQQTYGYFEMRADFSEAKGAWDAFWLLPTQQINQGKNGGWQELDIVEHYGNNPNGVYRWLHTTDAHADPNADLQVYSEHAGITTGFHTYGMDWQADTISFYFDGQLVGTKATPSDMHGPMFILANLAMENGADPSAPPAEMKIDYIRAYAEQPAVVTPPPEPVNIVTGTAGNDVLRGTSGRDRVIGGEGSDTLIGGKGADELIGGDGQDTASYANAQQGVTASLLDPSKNTGDAAGDTYSSIERLIGSDYNDTLEGDAGDNILNGGKGADRMIGGGGNDVYFVENTWDIVIEAAKGGNDLVITTTSYKLAAGQEIETLRSAEGSGSLTLTGNEIDNYLYANESATKLYGGLGRDVLVGGKGDDWLSGDAGSDRLTGGAGRDTFVFSTAPRAGEYDVITDFNVVDDRIALSLAAFGKAGAAPGALDPSAFYADTGNTAHAASDRIIYNSKTGDLFYDADGTGPDAAIRFAQTQPGLALTADDFFLIG